MKKKIVEEVTPPKSPAVVLLLPVKPGLPVEPSLLPEVPPPQPIEDQIRPPLPPEGK